MKKVIIIGAGIIGVTTAYQLAKQGVNVTIVDRVDDGQATEAAAGIICPWLAQRRNKAWYNLARSGAKIYPKLIAELEDAGETHTGYKRVGAIKLHTNEEKLQATKERALKRRMDAPEIGEITMLNEQDTHMQFPILDPIFKSLHVEGAARVDGRALRHALLRQAKKQGATFIEGHADLISQGNNITGIRVHHEKREADLVIATCGAWMNSLFEPLNITFKVHPQKAQIVHLELPQFATHNWPVVMPPNNQYMLTLGNRIVIGATHETKAGFDYRVTAGGVHDILSKAFNIAPDLRESTYLETRVGFRPFTPQSMPIIGKLPHYDNILLANGLGASGLTTGPFVGVQLAKLALEQEIDINLDDYDVNIALTESN